MVKKLVSARPSDQVEAGLQGEKTHLTVGPLDEDLELPFDLGLSLNWRPDFQDESPERLERHLRLIYNYTVKRHI